MALRLGKSFWKVAAIVAAATVGDGIFALPFAFQQSGWLLSIFYLLILGAIVVSAHVVYLKTPEKIGERERLLGLARRYLGAGGFWVGFVAIVLGLLLTLVAYLILGSQFIRLGFSGAPSWLPLFLFWIFLAVIAILPDAELIELELIGIGCTAIVIVLIFTTALPHVNFDGAPAFNWQNAFLPFGVVLFSIAGWTSVEPAYELRRKAGRGGRKKWDPWPALAMGTALAALLYIMFAAGILGTASQITPDTISGLGDWAMWERDILAALGLFTVATVSMPITREIKSSLEKDLRWNKFWSRALIVTFPISCVLLGLSNFLIVVGLVGGVFLGLQYLLIVLVGRCVLNLSLAKRILLDIVMAIFIGAAIYQIASFIVR
jgi:hypothetical protein